MSHLTRSVAILAGGQATRFGGRDKSALLVDGRSILDRQLASLAPLTGDLMIVGDRDVAARAIPLRAIPDAVPGCGPLGGLHAALTAARGGRVAILACDMPHVTAPLVAYLFSLAAEAEILAVLKT